MLVEITENELIVNTDKIVFIHRVENVNGEYMFRIVTENREMRVWFDTKDEAIRARKKLLDVHNQKVIQ